MRRRRQRKRRHGVPQTKKETPTDPLRGPGSGSTKETLSRVRRRLPRKKSSERSSLRFHGKVDRGIEAVNEIDPRR